MRAMFEARFQSFEDSSERAESASRVSALRAELKRQGLDGFVVPRADRQQNEYLPASEERLAWLTGFTGSAGAAVVLLDRAAAFVDGRYTVQAATQIDTAVFAIEHFVERPPDEWLAQNVKAGDRIGYDPWLHTADGVDRLRKACAKAGAELIALESNPIDALWKDRPASPMGHAFVHSLAYAGVSHGEKRTAAAKALRNAGADAVLLSASDSVNWLVNSDR